MRFLFIGDIVGKPGRDIVCRAVKGLVAKYNLDLVIANAENAAGGSGLTPAIYRELIRTGVDGIRVAEAVARDSLGLPAADSGARPNPDCAY